METGNFVSLKEFDCKSFQKPNLLNFPSQAMTIGAVKEHTYAVLQRQQNALPLDYIFKCLM